LSLHNLELFSFKATAPTSTYTLSLHDALPISGDRIVAVVALALRRLGAARHDERRGRIRIDHGIAERVEARLGRRIQFGTDIAARDGIGVALDDVPSLESADIDRVELAEALV